MRGELWRQKPGVQGRRQVERPGSYRENAALVSISVFGFTTEGAALALSNAGHCLEGA